MPMVTYTNEEKLAAVKRELNYRRRVYANRVRDFKMTKELMNKEIAIFEAIQADYEVLAQAERLL